MRVRAGWLTSLGMLGGVGVVTGSLRALRVESPTTAALAYLLVVLFAASWTTLPLAVATSLAATLSLNFFFMPPFGTFTIADPHNWVALGAFLVVAVVASNLSATARSRAQDAIERRNEVSRLFDVSRDILLTTDGGHASQAVAAHVARRFELPVVAVALPGESGGWRVEHGGVESPDVPAAALGRAWAQARGALEFDARTRTYSGHQPIELSGGPAHLVPIRVGVRAVGLMVLGGRPVDPGTADAIAGILAIALERGKLLDDRRAAELARQRGELSSALLASLGHDLRTPLTAISVAVANAADDQMPPHERRQQTDLALNELDRLSRLVQEILDMARIEAHGVEAAPQWVSPAAIVEAAVAHVGTMPGRHHLVVEGAEDVEVNVDPRLTASALAHVLENAARYSPAGSTVHVSAYADDDGLRLTVDDEGPGLSDADMARLFEPFVRGDAARAVPSGTGLGLAITKGLLAAEGGRIWAERRAGHGARFTLVVPSVTRPAMAQEDE